VLCVTVAQNKNFISVKKYYKKVTMKALFKSNVTKHSVSERADRLYKAFSLIGNTDCVLDVFEVDKGHPAGSEIHCVLNSGVIIILNKRKYENGWNGLITALIARPNQVHRLYKACGLKPKKELIEKCYVHQKQGMNKE